jgi:hypothetical protein
MKRLVLSLSILLSVICSPESALSQQIDSPNSSTLESELILIRQQYEMLRQQNEALAQSIQSERENHYQFVQRTYSEIRNFIGAFLAITGALIVFFNFRSTSDLKKEFENQLKDSRKSLAEEIEKFELEVKKDAEEKFLDAVNSALGNLQESQGSLRRMINLEAGYQSRRIGIFGESNQLEEIDDALERLQARGFTSISRNPIIGQDWLVEVEIDSYDIFVYLYSDAQTLADLIGKFQSLTIPIIIFSGQERVPSDILEGYQWAVPVNTKITLINSIFSVSNVFLRPGSF